MSDQDDADFLWALSEEMLIADPGVAPSDLVQYRHLVAPHTDVSRKALRLKQIAMRLRLQVIAEDGRSDG